MRECLKISTYVGLEEKIRGTKGKNECRKKEINAIISKQNKITIKMWEMSNGINRDWLIIITKREITRYRK